MTEVVKGMPLPQLKPPTAGNPNASAAADINQSAERQTALINATKGGSKNKNKNKKYKYGGGVVVPQLDVPYTSTAAKGQDPNSIMTQNAGLSVQSTENQKFDSYARVGGSRKKKSVKNLVKNKNKHKNKKNKRKTYKKRRITSRK